MISARFFRVRVGNFFPGNGRVLPDFVVYQFFHVSLLLRAERGTAEVESEFVGAHVTSFLRGIPRNQLVQGPMQKMSHGVMPLDGIAPVGVDRHAHRFARFGRAPLRESCTVHKDITAFLRVLDPKLTDLGAVVSGNMKQSLIAHLSAHLGVTRSLIEHDVDFFGSLSRQNRLHHRLRLKKVMAEKPGRATWRLLSSTLIVSFFCAERPLAR